LTHQDFLETSGEFMSQHSEVLRERERFYVSATLEDYLFCGDDRTKEALLSLFGGVLNISYNQQVLQEAVHPGSVNKPFDQTAREQTILIINKGGLPNAGVHSDTGAEGEHAHDIDVSKADGKVGCGYAELRGSISSLIVERADEIMELARTLRPELFATDQDEAQTRRLIAAHGRIAGRSSILPPGRQIVLSAKEAGAHSMVVDGPHTSKTGIINLRKNTKMDKTAAANAGLPTYTHDEWVALEVFDNLHDFFPYDKRMFDQGETIDTIGTMLALGVEEIAVRR
jgi:hypothetical protein